MISFLPPPCPAPAGYTRRTFRCERPRAGARPVSGPARQGLRFSPKTQLASDVHRLRGSRFRVAAALVAAGVAKRRPRRAARGGRGQPRDYTEAGTARSICVGRTPRSGEDRQSPKRGRSPPRSARMWFQLRAGERFSPFLAPGRGPAGADLPAAAGAARACAAAVSAPTPPPHRLGPTTPDAVPAFAVPPER